MPEAKQEVAQLKAAILQQPVSISIAANNKYIHSYEGGIIHAADCTTEKLYDGVDINPINHAVLIVGYGTDEATGLGYWLIKNSWADTWGE